MDSSPFRVSLFYLDVEAVENTVWHHIDDSGKLTNRLVAARKLAIKHDRQMYIGAYNHLIQMLADWKKTGETLHSLAKGFAEDGVNPDRQARLFKDTGL